MSDIQHAHLYGTRDNKYEWLLNHDVSSTTWTELEPQKPFHLFIPQNNDLLGEYQAYWKITEAMPVNVLGFQTHRDHFAIDFDQEKLKQRISEMRDGNISDSEYSKKYDVKDNRDWKIREVRRKIRNNSDWEKDVIECSYRPFDPRPCYFSYVAMDCPRRELLDHVAGRENISMLLIRQMQDKVPYSHVLSSCIPSIDRVFSCSRGAATVFPLYLYFDRNSLTQERRPNFSAVFLKDIVVKLDYTPTPEAIFYYIYAVFHSPTYRSRYAQFLKIDFPRVPLTSNVDLFRQLSAYGEALVALHLMKSPKLDTLNTQFVDAGGDLAVDPGHPKYDEGSSSVLINKKGDKFTGVPKAVWEFYVGGYQVCHKWLKDRKGSTLSEDDITHYQRIVVALQETIRLMQQIDEAIPSFPIE